MPDMTIPTSTDAKVLGEKLMEWQTILGGYDLKMQDSLGALNAIVVPQVVGIVLHPKKGKKTLLIDDFEKGTTTNALNGQWGTDCDKYGLGTTVNPNPFQVAGGGHRGSAKHSAHIWGHFGRSVAPWPYVALVSTLASGGAAVDVSQFKGIEFWVKGNGKTYTLMLDSSSVQDYCYYRKEFKATATWSKVFLKFSDFTQPLWGKPLPLKVTDLTNITFSVGSSFSDEDYDLWVDDVALVK
jgi:hypothetical protein